MRLVEDIPFRQLARTVFTTCLLTFIASRTLVILIMARAIPDLFLHMGETHVHHLNYGIFLLTGLGGVLLFLQVTPRERWWCAVIYGISLALTFDEFGMWLHLGGSYWQRASFDAVIVILSLLGMFAFAPSLEHMREYHWITGTAMVVLTALFYLLLLSSLNYAGKRVGPKLQKLEELGPR